MACAFVCEMSVYDISFRETVFINQNILYIMLFTKGEHMIRQAVTLSSPVSAVHARNTWNHEPPLMTKTLAF